MGASIARHDRERRRVALTRVLEALDEALRDAPAPVRRLARAARSIDVTNEWPGMSLPRARLPVCHFWERALHAATRGPAASLARAIGDIGPLLTWTQNPNYRRRPPARRFLANYGYAVIAGPADGPAALAVDPEIAFGVLLLGPATLYSPHAHPAVEVYYTLTSGSEWWRDAGPWRRTPAATTIYHAPHVRHATRARRTPMLALYLWRGDLATHARLVSGRRARVVGT